MDKKILEYVIEKTHILMHSPSCSHEAKAAAQAWLNAVGTETEAAETKKYVTELEADLMPVDNLIDFTESKNGIQLFGADTAHKIAVHAKAIKAAGADYCDCPACTAAVAILEKKELF
ncbi:molecular chaperone Hsp90 [Megasphaera cerevisiae DSM 20462]|jgi:hypothetical protein|uniref:Molecular chaperone Hsp90 n=1 Tax=Megasphaera cerevisiae DSM 20462 TaxID=1122219 RepID=A0A0J6X034_9FIRM|nr:hypothetical protein [Megasphaera cerevisiae]KMO87883.1 molecular chaperone Hsp90 [Megasphaera cerevisiae DSM 20462]MCI1750112.1 molecular chaperone Hsp90 [Megasphaera cerevisiae]SJZ42658.1 hypothetical protein SAMN05660900_00334 [Megasphaera cerevisiae DSM 20462]